MSAIINFKTDPKIKKEAQKLAKKMGLSLSAVLNIYLRDFIHSQEINIYSQPSPQNSLIKEKAAKYSSSSKLLKELKEAEEDVKKGRVVSFSNPKDALRYLDTLD